MLPILFSAHAWRLVAKAELRRFLIATRVPISESLSSATRYTALGTEALLIIFLSEILLIRSWPLDCC